MFVFIFQFPDFTLTQFLSTMLEGLRRWAKNHQRGLTVTAVVGGSVVYGWRSLRRYRNYRVDLWRAEAQRQAHKKHVFTQSNQAAQQAVTSIIPDLREELYNSIPLPTKDELRASLTTTQENKIIYWNNLKIQGLIARKKLEYILYY